MSQPPIGSRSTLYFSKIIISAIVLLAGFKFADRMARRTESLPAAPDPNSYETVVAIGKDVEVPSGGLDELGSATIQKIADANRGRLERLHAVLGKEMAVPLSVSKGWAEQHARDVKTLKRLAAALGVQSKAELDQGRTNASTACLVDIVLLGQDVVRGGVVSDCVNGMLIETIGTALLKAQIPHMDAASCRRAAQELERFEERRESADRVLMTEHAWSTRKFGITGRAMDLFFAKSQTQRQAEFKKRYDTVVLRTRKLSLSLATAAVQKECGKEVANAREVVPGVLAAVPVDPGTGKPLTVRSDDDEAAQLAQGEQ